MLKYGGAAIPMQRSLDREQLQGIQYLVGSEEILTHMPQTKAREPFEEEIQDFLNSLSRSLLSMPEAKLYPDVVTFAFWIRRSSVKKLAERFGSGKAEIHLGRGTAFHIAPSNVAVNYAYSFAAGIMTGNANIVRIPSKDFPQISVINRAVNSVLNQYPKVKPYVCFVRYGREQRINDVLSSISDVRIIWGGDRTIEELRKSPIGPRATEITFADRYSLAVMDSDTYMNTEYPERIADDFYNDTYLTDQNACTSPRIVIWCGSRIDEAKERFWSLLLKKVQDKYEFQPVQGVNKLTNVCLLSAVHEGIHPIYCGDNRLVRVALKNLFEDLMDFRGDSGYFYEYDCQDLLELKILCDNSHCQTVSYLGDPDMFLPLIKAGVRGIDRIVPIGKTMDFDMIWDGYNLYERLTRTVHIWKELKR